MTRCSYNFSPTATRSFTITNGLRLIHHKKPGQVETKFFMAQYVSHGVLRDIARARAVTDEQFFLCMCPHRVGRCGDHSHTRTYGSVRSLVDPYIVFAMMQFGRNYCCLCSEEPHRALLQAAPSPNLRSWPSTYHTYLGFSVRSMCKRETKSLYDLLGELILSASRC